MTSADSHKYPPGSDLPLLLVDIDGVLSLFGGDLGSHARLVPLDRGHSALPFVHRRRSPARPDRAFRAGLVQRLGGEGRRAPSTPARAAFGYPLPALRSHRRAPMPTGSSPRSIATRRAPAGTGRRRAQRRLSRVGRALARRRRCWTCRPSPRTGSRGRQRELLLEWARRAWHRRDGRAGATSSGCGHGRSGAGRPAGACGGSGVERAQRQACGGGGTMLSASDQRPSPSLQPLREHRLRRPVRRAGPRCGPGSAPSRRRSARRPGRRACR